jgi:hypothetical protein
MPNVKFLEVFLESIPCLLILDNLAFDDAMKGGERTPSRERETA